MGRLVSCSSCGRIHDSKFICNSKKERKLQYARIRREKKKDPRNSRRWQKTSSHIKDRDKGLCQMCIRELYMTEYMKKYNYTDLSVHHILPLKDREDLAFADHNLITLCSYHHNMVEDNSKFIKILMDIAVEQIEKDI